MKAENRQEFRKDERAYLDEWELTEAQKQALLARDYNATIDEGGNVYFLVQIVLRPTARASSSPPASMTGMSPGGLCRR